VSQFIFQAKKAKTYRWRFCRHCDSISRNRR